MFRRDVILIGTALLFGLVSMGHVRHLHAQSPTAPPVFRTGVEAIQLDVTVTDRDGRPITDLAASDFDVLENGVRRDVTTFTNIDVPSVATDTAVDGAETDVATNTAPNGRVYVIAFDTLSPENGLRARHLLRSFLDKHFGPNDLGAVVATSRALRSAGQDFTRSKSRLLDAIDRFSGWPVGSGSTLETINQLGSLADLVEFTLKLPYGRKALLFVAEDFLEDVGAVLEVSSRAKTLRDYCVQTVITSDRPETRRPNLWMTCEPSQYLHRSLVAAARSNLVIYPIDPTGLDSRIGSGGRNHDFVDLATATGGFAVTNTNTFDEHFARIAAHHGNYYLLGFNSAYKGQVGRAVPLSVTVKRPGAVVNARSSYVSPFPEEKKLFDPTSRRAIVDALISPVPTAGLPLEMTTAAFKGPEGNATVALTIQVDPSKVSLAELGGRFTGRLELWTKLTLEGLEGEGKKFEVKFDMTRQTRSRINETGLRLLAPLAVGEGRYQLRIAFGSDQLAGGVIADLEVPDFESRFVMGGLLVGSDQSDAVHTVTPNNTGRIPGGSAVIPTTKREFSRNDVIKIYTELYDKKASAGDFGAHLELRNEAGNVALSKPLERVPGESGLLEGHRMRVALPLADVAPGRYALQVHGRSGNNRDQRATRSLIVRVK